MKENSPLLQKKTSSDSSKVMKWTAWIAYICSMVFLVSMSYHPTGLCGLKEAIDAEFDVIIVGGGPAGSVLASLLAQSKAFDQKLVLLIEAGDRTQLDLGGQRFVHTQHHKFPITPFDVPYFWSNVSALKEYHWDVDNVLIAKALGGCGIHNAMLYVRALQNDIEGWNMQPTWTWEKALNIYLKTEEFEDYNETISDYHGNYGLVRTSRPQYIDNTSRSFHSACLEAGIPNTEDFNSPNGRHGAGFYHFNIRNGIRDSAARTFLTPLLKLQYSNFQLLLNTTVTKLNIDANTTINGVTVQLPDNTIQRIRCRKNGLVVLTAGAIHSPKLLTLSGLASETTLKDLNISIVKHLPLVGTNLQDHTAIAMTFTKSKFKHKAKRDIILEMSQYMEQIALTNTSTTTLNTSVDYGLLGSTGISVGAFLIPPGSTSPEIQLTFFENPLEPHILHSKQNKYNHFSTNKTTLKNQLNSTQVYLVTIALLKPEARNYIHVMSNDFNTPVRVEPEIPEKQSEHLSEYDVMKLVWSVNIVRDIVSNTAMKDLILAENSPGSRIQSNNDIRYWIHQTAFRNSHWVGSAKIGTNEYNGVVDSNLTVFGVPNLKIADASVIPIIPNGNVHSTVVMVASMAAEIIMNETSSIP